MKTEQPCLRESVLVLAEYLFQPRTALGTHFFSTSFCSRRAFACYIVAYTFYTLGSRERQELQKR